MVDFLYIAVAILRLILFGLALGLTIISFQAYQQQRSKRLEFAFIGFAFISMGTAMTNLTVQTGVEEENVLMYLQMAETLPFIVGFSMLYASLYR